MASAYAPAASSANPSDRCGVGHDRRARQGIVDGAERQKRRAARRWLFREHPLIAGSQCLPGALEIRRGGMRKDVVRLDRIARIEFPRPSKRGSGVVGLLRRLQREPPQDVDVRCRRAARPPPHRTPAAPRPGGPAGRRPGQARRATGRRAGPARPATRALRSTRARGCGDPTRPERPPCGQSLVRATPGHCSRQWASRSAPVREPRRRTRPAAQSCSRPQARSSRPSRDGQRHCTARRSLMGSGAASLASPRVLERPPLLVECRAREAARTPPAACELPSVRPSRRRVMPGRSGHAPMWGRARSRAAATAPRARNVRRSRWSLAHRA